MTIIIYSQSRTTAETNYRKILTSSDSLIANNNYIYIHPYLVVTGRCPRGMHMWKLKSLKNKKFPSFIGVF